MTKLPSVPHSVARLSAVALAALLLTTSCRGFAGGGHPPGLSGHPGQNAAATRGYLNARNFTVLDSAFSGPLDCEDPSKCGGQSAVNIQIVPEKDAFRARVDSSLVSGNGHIVAKITNLDNVPFHPYGLAARDVAYLWVGAMPAGTPKIAIFRISESGQATLLATAAQAGFCPDGTRGRSKSAVHLNATPMCTERSLYTASSPDFGAARLASVNAGNVFLLAATTRAFSHARGLWFSCSLGCCEARGFEPAEAF